MLQTFSLSLWLVGSLLVFCSPLSAQERAASQNVLDDTWQIVMIQGNRVGYVHSLTWEAGEGEDQRIWSEALTQMTLSRFGAELTMTVTQITAEDDAGNLKAFKLETDNPPMSHTVVSGKVEGDTLHITTTAAGKTTSTRQPWDADVKSPVYQDRLLENDPLEVGEQRTFRSFNPQFLKVGEVTLTGMEPAVTELLDGSKPRLNRTRIVDSLVPGLVMTSYQNEDGETLKTETNLLGMVTYTVSREEAVEEIAGVQLDLALDTMVSVEPISDAHSRGTIVYEISVEPPHRMLTLPEGDTQSVARSNEQTIRVTVHPVDLPTAGPSNLEQRMDEAYLGSSRYLECGHPQVVALAKDATGDLRSPAEIARVMEKYVYEKLAAKNFSTALATAAEVASSLEGDCTEHAMLLAAMLRVKEIPSRIAVGLVYSEPHSAFVGHMWTEAHVSGRWVPLDATRGEGGIGIGYLKFANSSLSDEGPSPVTAFVPLVGLVQKMEIEVISSDDE